MWLEWLGGSWLLITKLSLSFVSNQGICDAIIQAEWVKNGRTAGQGGGYA